MTDPPDDASSALASNLTEKINSTFPHHLLKPVKMAEQVAVNFINLLGGDQAAVLFVSALEAAGYASPAQIVNSFSNGPTVVAYALGKIGAWYTSSILLRYLIIYACNANSIPLNSIEVPESHQGQKKDSQFNKIFTEYTDEQLSDAQLKVQDDANMLTTQPLYHAIKVTMRTWLNRAEAPSIQGFDTLPDVGEPATPQCLQQLDQECEAEVTKNRPPSIVNLPPPPAQEQPY